MANSIGSSLRAAIQEPVPKECDSNNNSIDYDSRRHRQVASEQAEVKLSFPSKLCALNRLNSHDAYRSE